ncbi:MAG: amidohydrolase family protein [Clostridia bacterium]|nr:amidohydrolase family protein [Clostridia bacterium]
MSNMIIDCHCHLGRYFNFNVPGHSPADMIKSMDNISVSRACISAHMTLTSDIEPGNEEMLGAVSLFPGRFVGFFTFNPHYPELMGSLMPEYFKNKGVRGIKIHQGTHMTSLMNPDYRACYSFADKYRLPVLIHTWDGETIEGIRELSSEYTGAVFIMGHFGAAPANMKKAADVIKTRNNVFGDTALSMMMERNIEWLVEIAGADKVLYGTDMPFIDPRACLGRILGAHISVPDRERILGMNFNEILENVKDHEN